MDDNMLARIKGDPNYQVLVKERSGFGWTLAILMLVLYYGYIAVVAFDPDVFGVKVSGMVTVGLIVGVALIAVSILLTGVYVIRANSRYDTLTRAIVAKAMGAAR
jgi:uncharacterized membrane protein (DUF485 family)